MHEKAIIDRDAEGNAGVRCRCGEFKLFGAKCTAKMLMGHDLFRNCKCGFHVQIGAKDSTYVIKRQVEGHIFERGMEPVEQ